MKIVNKLILCVLIFIQGIDAKNIIWDLDGVLIATSRIGVAREIGIVNFLRYVAFDWKSPKGIQSKVFGVLRKIKNDTGQDLYDTVKIPDLFMELLSGKIACDEVLRLTFEKIEELSQDSNDSKDSKFFCSDREAQLTKLTARAMFTPAIRAMNTLVIPHIVEILKECINAKDKDGRPLHKVFILSNYEKEIYTYLKETPLFKELFELFDQENIFISGIIGFSKPDLKAFEYVLGKGSMNPNDCIFIDDRIENVQAAAFLGITAIHLSNPDQAWLRSKLNELDIIK